MQAYYNFAVVFYLKAVFQSHLCQRCTVVENTPLDFRLVIFRHAVYLQILALEVRSRFYCQAYRVDLLLEALGLDHKRVVLNYFLLVTRYFGFVLGLRINAKLRVEKVDGFFTLRL